jgi:hypothetical protein
MHIFVLTATYELRVRRKSHLCDHPTGVPPVAGILAFAFVPSSVGALQMLASLLLLGSLVPTVSSITAVATVVLSLESLLFFNVPALAGVATVVTLVGTCYIS